MNRLAEQLIINILKNEMGIKNDRIWIRNQNRKIPEDNGLFIVVGFVDGRLIGNDNQCLPTDTGMTEQQRVIMLENIQIDILSRNDDALMRHWEVAAAMHSIYAKQTQEANYFKIYRIPSQFINTSVAEGSSMLNRFTIIIPAQVWYYKEKVLSSPNGGYFDSFDTRVDDEETIGEPHGIIEFTITK